MQIDNNKHKDFKKRLISFSFAMLFVLFCQAQSIFDLRLKLTIEGGSLEHAKISINKDGKPWRNVDSKAKYDIDLELGYEYEITATKLGYITKSIIVDTRVPEGKEHDEFARFQSEIILKPQPEGKEIIYTQPVGRIGYSKQEKDFDYDKDYTAKSLEKMLEAEANPRDRPKAEVEPVVKEKEPVKKEKEVSKPIEINKTVEYKGEKNPNPPKEKIVTPPTPPSTRNVVERTVQQDKLKITYRTVTINGEAMEYRKEEFSWGGVYFYRGVKNITEAAFEKDTR